jgi:hypothetical protein
LLVWLWEADGPGRFRGVSDDEDEARQAAARCLISGQAQTASVEAATLALGVSSVEDAYQRAGVGWTGRRTDRGVRWTPLAPGVPA